MIIGQPGSGKSTLARAMGEVLTLPVVHIDLIHWQSGWVERSAAEKDRLCSQAHAQDKWVFEGGRTPTWPERLDRADTLVWLDVPLPVRAWRVFWRTIQNQGNSRPDLPDGCPERFNWTFTKWIWNTRHSQRDKMMQLYNAAPAEKRKFKLTNAKSVSAFLESLTSAKKCNGKQLVQ